MGCKKMQQEIAAEDIVNNSQMFGTKSVVKL